MITYAQKLRSLRPAAASDEAAATPSPIIALAPLGDGRVQARVLGLLADTLGVPAASVTPGTPFAELGMGSLLGVRFLDAVNRAFGLWLGVDALFAHSTAAALAAHIDRLAPAPAIGAAPVPEPQPASTVQPAAGDIAVIGMAGRFATAPDLAAFWQALTEGRCLVREVPPDRWSAAAFHDPDPAAIGRSISKWAGFMDDIDRFDAGFFNISPREAAAMDPQHRLFLEQAWLALEDAGYAPDRLKGSATGVYVGGSGSGYETMLAPDAKAAQSYGLTGNLVSLLASRIAYFLDLRGPALVVDTACSASLVALDLACQALQRGEIDMALVGGVSLFLDEKPFVAMTRTGMLSPDGRCRTFDADANGIAVGEAAAAVVLKPLARALTDGDRVDAVIKASGTNQDGRSNGITAPNPEAQAALLRAVQARAGIDPATITYAEAHGTGTPLGDPIEVAALRTALGVRAADMPPCALGAVKSNIGHTAEAAGLAGLIKTVLCLKHGELVPSVNFATLNPKIDLSDVPLAVETRHRPWTTAPGTPRRACVSAFGLSGTNAHVVLEQAPAQPPPRAVATDEPQLLLISARDAQALERRVSDLAAWLRDTAEPLADVAATLALGRGHFEHRAALIANSTAEAASLLAAGRQRTAVLRRGDAPNVAPNGPTLEQRAAAYLAGAMPDWPELWSGARRNLSLPGYPFTRAEHWAARRPVAVPVAHPFADAGEAPGIARRFTPADPVARDHVIGSVPLIHAAIFLEMARLAAEASGGAPVGALRDIAWNRTVPVPPDGVRVAIGTETSPQGLTCVMRAGEETAPVATCIAVVSAAAAMPAPIAAAMLQRAATQHATRAELDALDRGSVRLGPSFAGFDELWVGDEAALSWVGAVPDDGCVLSPRLMDAAIQTGAALLARGDGPQFRLRYPAGVAEIALLRPIPRDGCFIRATRAGADRVDLTIAGPDGQPVLHWTRFELRPTGADRAEPRQEVAPQTFRPAWVKCPAGDGPLIPPHAVVGDAAILAWLAGAWPAGVAQTATADDMAALDRIAASVPADGRILFAAFEDDATPGLLRLTKALAARGLDGSAIDLRVLTACAHTVTGQETLVPVVAPIQGLAKAIGREFPSWRVTVLDLPATELTPATREAVLRATAPATGEPLAWRDGAWFERRLEPIEAVAAGTILRPGGAYLLIGGMGRVGREIARHLARTHRARLTLVGRAALDADRQAFLDELAALGAEAVYHPADITQPGALRPVVAAAQQRFGTLHGAIHAVVDPLFARLAQTTEDAFAAALRPKVDGLRELAAAIADQPLDFLAIFSSIGAYAGFPGNVGQASYCAACCFEDSFAAALHADGRPVRLIQWGLWEHEAFQGEGLRRLQRQGTYPMRTDAAVAAFEQIVAGQAAHVVHASLSSAVWQGMGAVVPGEGADAAIAAMRVIAQGAAKSDPTLHVAVDAYARVLTRAMLQERGLLAAGEASGILRHRLPVLPRHHRLFDAILALLAHDEGAAPTRDALLARAPSVREPLELLELCVAALPDVLSGERQGTDVMFPGGSMRLVEAIYRNQPVLAACNAMVAAAVAAARPTRILEIGAGTGATADAVLAALPPAPGAEYHFTDISPGFVRHAKQRIADPRARFAVLDIEQDPLAQGMAAGSFDLVLATNVLHATRDMAETLDHIAALLRPGGLLVVNEMAVAEDFATLTFGLLEGWWRATDTPNRLPHSPLLSVDLWRRALHRAGFAPVEATAAPGFPEAASCPQVVLLASKVNAEAAKPAMASAPPVVPAAQSAVPATASDVEAMVRDRVAAGLDLPAAAIDLETPFGELGVDSIVAPQIAEDINKVAGVSLRPTDLYNFATVRALAAHIAAKFPAARVASPAVDVVPDSGVVDQPVLPTVGPQTPPHPDIPDDAIAIIGMAGRFPDAPDLEAYWRNIAEGRSAVREIDRFDITPYFDPEPGRAGKTYAKWAATLADYDRFDPLFFSISPAEAEAMDPQQRLLLEEAWHALEDAGATPSRLDGARCGVFVGASANSYAAPASPSLQTLGGSMAILSARLSYFLNLKGPTFPVDTGCSSSLVALHLACQSLRTHESDMALAAGVSCNLLSAPIFFYLSDAGMASPVGQCKTFDDAADGFVPGEGVGVVVLKRLKDALRDGDRIQALLLGTGINQDGKTSGLTAPSATSQTELECAVYRQAGIDPATIGLIEAHGTGTRLGDPIEVAALTDAFAAFTPAKGFCAIGSVKTNIGHAMAAAGVAGLLKAVQALRHRTLPPSLNFSTPNRHIDFANSPFVVNTAARTWESMTPRRAAVSSFGFSGTNAHVVVQEAPPQVRTVPTPGPFLFVVSARSEAALTRRLDDLRQWLRAHPDLEAGDLAYTLAVRRAHFRHRRAFVADSVAGLLQALDGDVIAADAPAELGTLARRYRDGEAVDFGFLSGNLVDLPGYPFERERFWNPETKVAMADPGPARNDVAASWLTREHVIQGRRLLPGAAFLELARAAMRGGEAAVALRDVLWQAPVDATSGPTFVVTDVGSDGTCTLRVGDAAHATARIAAANPALPASLDLAAIAARCTRRFDGQAVYAAAGGHGFAYGETYRVIRDVAVGEGEALAFLSAPPDRGEGWVWHPALLDGALQAASCIGLAGTTGDQPAFVPFALGSFAARHPLTGACAVHARRTGSGPDLMTFDIAICTQDGAVLAQARGLQARALTAPAAEAATLLYTPVWEATPGTPSDTIGPVIACGTDAQLADLARVLPGRRLVRVTAGSGFARLDADRFMIDPAHPDDHARLLVEAAPGPGATVALLWDLEAPPNGPSLAGAQEAMDPDTGPRALMAAVQAALRAPEAGVGRILYAGTSSPRSAAAAAFARTVGLESTRLSCSVLATAATDIGAVAREVCLVPDTAEILWRDGTRMARGLAPMANGTQAGAIAEGGVWVITGGAGAIGLTLARHLARTRRPALILIGRSDLSPAQERTLAEIEALGADVLYLRADVTSGASLRTALDKARRRFGPITGVIHAAGILRDARIVQSEMADVDTVLRTKVAGAVALDHLTRDDPVSAFVLFSSTAAAFGSAGQGAYAAANGFLDGFAGWRSAQGRAGRTASINWPLWRDGGMLPPQEVMAALARSAGLTPMPDAAALAAFEQVLAADATQVVVLHGNPPALRRFAGGGSPDTPARVPAQAAPVGDLRQRTEAYLRTVMSGVIKLAPERIDAAERFEAYGVDSMMIVRMNQQLEQDLGDLPKTLFFEYQTVQDLAAHLLDTQAEALGLHFGRGTSAEPADVPAEPTPPRQDPPAAAVIALIDRPATAADDGAVAVVGIAGIYPQANDLAQFWRNLAAGRDCIVEIPPDRWALEGFYDPDRARPETSYSKWGGFIDGVDLFDARFFNISPREADALDPQARKFLEVAWATMEDAGLTRDTLFHGDPDPSARLCGVFVGVMYGDYQLFGPEEAARGNLIAPNAAYWNIANRVSHFLDLHGPSMAVDTACSSSLSAIHTAIAALRNGDCTIAFAGGVNVTVHPGKHWILSKSGFAASDGRCRSFGEGGDGYVPGEGVGAVLLKPLARALADGDRIHAIIRSSAVNHGGRTNGYTVPNPVAQGSLIAAALRRGGIAPETIDYVEAHGTGTALGDPVEIAGLARAFSGAPAGSIAVGSVKSNIGHLESAAGIAALTKVVLQLRHRALAPSLHADRLNPNLKLETTPFVIQRGLAPWPAQANRPRRAGISSFGAGGANAHLVIEEAPHQPLDPPWEDGPLLVPLSAATPEALIRLATILADWLDENGAEADFASIARTLQTGREAMRHRLVVTASSAADLARLLRRFAANKAVAPPPEVAEWVAGGRFDWDAMAPGPRRPVSLPTYPFAQRRCWVELTAAAADVPAALPTVGSMPAISCTVSDPLVADHRLGGDLVLAGAFLLNAAREAAGGVAPAMADISFRRPVTPSMAPLAAIEPDRHFAIRVDGADHATGRLLAEAGVRPDPLDLAVIAERCAEELAHDAVYGALALGGVAYGPTYRLLDTVWRGDGEALAELRPIDSVVGWAPNLLDAAFQLSFAVATAAGGLAPFAIDRIAAWGELGTATHVHAQRREAGADFLRLDLRVTDEDGAVLLAIDGFVARRPAPVLPLRLLEPEWRRSDAIGTSLRTGRAVIVGDGFDLATAWPDATLTSADAVPADASQVWYVAPRGLDEAGTILPFLGLLRSLADRPAAPAVTVVVTCAHRVMPADIPDPSAAALAAFALSAGREHPDLRLRVIDADAGADAEALLHLPADAPLTALRNGVAHTRVLAETILPAAPAEPWRRGGVYLIAGGAGGIGLALAEHLVRSAGVRVALLGRRAADAALSERMAALGPDVMYVQADVTDSAALRHAIATVTARLGPINGAFHLALAMHDARAVTLTEPQLRSVLAPKVDGTRALMAALRDRPLDALMLFSSSNALTTNPGQSAYAAASAAQDAIGLGPAPWPVKIIDWGFWGEVGRVATPAYHASLARIGVYPIATREGLATIEQMLAAPQSQIVPLRISDAVAAALGVRPPGALQDIVGAIAPRAAGAVQMLAEAAKAFGAVDTYAAGLLLLAIQGMGGLTEAGASAGEDFPAMLGVQPRFARLFDALQDMLLRAGFLARDGSSFVATEAVTQPRATRTADLVQRRAGWIAEQPQVAPYLDLLDACAIRLPDILRGTVDANDVLFPDGSSHLVEPIYRGNQVVDHFQAIVADATVAAVQARLRDLPPETPVRILEIGAGTGGTTAFVLPALTPFADRVRYVFTDVGRMFLDAARARFDEYGFLSVEHLDIEQSPTTQGFPTHGFDIVIAANVLHATRDIARTLAQVRVLCRKGGILLLNEATARQDFNTMTFGLTRGWWLFQDADRRIAHAPLLSVSAWRDALSAHGFAPLQVLAGGDGAMQAVIAAEGDGAGDAAISPPVGTPTDARPTPAATSAGNSIPAIEATLRATVAKSLRLTPEEVEADTSFSDYGADSIISVDLVREINAALGIELKTTALFNYSTVRTLAGYIASEYADRFTAVAEAPPKPVSRARERSERLREIIRKRRDGLTFAPPPDPPPAVTPLVPPPAQSAATPLDDEAALFSLLQRLQAGEIDVAKALAETGDD